MSFNLIMLSFLTALSAVLIISKPSVAVFLSIDCGGSNSSTYKDERSIVWTGDNAYIHSDEVFPTLKKNCYTILDLDKGQRVLVRATFFYGNYDGKNFAPTFELHFDGNFWATVTTSNFTYVVEEAIYVVKGNATNICLAQTHPDQAPFISALELRSLDAEMYSNVGMNHALFLENRIAHSANQTVRNETDAIDVSAAKDHPPQVVLQNAVGTIGTAWGIGIQTTGLGSKKVPIFIIAYFSEVVRLNSTQKRSIEIVIDNEQFSNDFSPPFGSVLEVYITNITASSNTSFTVGVAAASSLPPIINAHEFYSISNALTEGTNNRDVEGLSALRKEFDVLKQWSVVTRLPSSFTWKWVECNADAIPLNFGLSGSLPDFSSMDVLQKIDLHNNSLNGTIPDFLGSFPDLLLLNLADNRFNGSVPTSLSKNKNLTLMVSGNCLSGMTCKAANVPPPPKQQSPDTPPPPTPNSGSQNSGDSKSVDMLQIILGVGVQISLLSLLLRNF
ncbi:hypothetical protein I3842_16G095800 [Carya illinoinensis]|uniref:Malectin-like domain-containing protein n=1 Tax=Carya illinoinensis TaxID=32201 RepID=A0A922A6W2_CARIL|nr:hypothetical protein I3842_16G095800 [Carya illinoinensis]